MRIDNYEWLEIVSSKINHPSLNLYKKDKELFFSDYLIIDNEDMLIIGNKKTYTIYEFAKVYDSFEFKRNIEERKTIFKFKNIEVIKKELD